VSPVVAQEGVEDVGHFVVLVVDDEWDGHYYYTYLMPSRAKRHSFPLAILLVEYIDLILLHVHQSKTSHSCSLPLF